MSSVVVVASRLAHVTRAGRRGKRKMNLAISLLALAALAHAATPQTPTKSVGVKGLEVKGAGSKKKESNQTSKRELFEGNFGDRTGGLIPKYGASGTEPGIEYSEELKEVPQDQSPQHQLFGVRLPQIAKISDVLTGQGPSFEDAVNSHLYSPVSVYQPRISIPTTFEVPVPAASQIALPQEFKTYHLQKHLEDQKLQIPRKDAELTQSNFKNAQLFAVKQPKFRLQLHPQQSEPGQSHKINIQPKILPLPQPFSKPPASPFFPVYDQTGPLSYPGHIVPLRYLQQQAIYQPVYPGYDYDNQEEKRSKKGYSNQENYEKLNEGPTESPTVQSEIPVLKHGYHAHPNGAISYTRFSLPSDVQQDKRILQSQSEIRQTNIQQHDENLQLQYKPLGTKNLQKQKFNHPQIYQKYQKDRIHQIYHPEYETRPQFIFVHPPIPNQSRALNPLQQHLLLQDSPPSVYPPTHQLQPISQSQHTAKYFVQPTRTAPRAQTLPHADAAHDDEQLAQPIPYEYRDLPAQQSRNIDQPILFSLAPMHHFTPLPPLKPNYSRYVQPLQPITTNTETLKPTTFLPLHPLHESTPKSQAVSDQLISSTTILPELNEYVETKEQSNQQQSQTSQPPPQLEPEIIHQSQPTVPLLSIQSTTHHPFSTTTPFVTQSEQLLQSTPQPQYQQTINFQSQNTFPKHTVEIQKQELRELIFETTPQSSSTPQYQPQLQKDVQHQEEKKKHQLQIQRHQDILKNSQQYQHELNELQQYQDGNRQIQALQQQLAEQEMKNLKYEKKQQSEPIQYQLQPQQTQQNETQQTQQQETEQIELQQQQQHEQQQPHEQEQLHEQEQPQDQQQPHEQLISEILTNQQIQHLEKQIQLSAQYPSQEPEKQQGQVEIQQQPELQQQPQQQVEVQHITEAPYEEQELSTSLDPTNHLEEPYLHTQLLQPQVLPNLYTRPEELNQAVFGHDVGSPVGSPVLPNVQYFGKYAEAIFRRIPPLTVR